ncbi:hypothetical protein PTRG_02455 [Pyrenophora tritici-repentis Pt-1C-BFP]|uniref:Uncharacterized protein n=1 Tax=Pyrenophora tritici-repentis (strain Pt-1C-BFP) TaxID=426418 RepID=B2VYG5_PYRTR|nr:uncharacterized protein PTRG_02455 [Pyrenophora tritici-repentis Pt-1C-BFP]EDU44978.1 hypothetical protein PTRG_02455 [Pyrenophora tritici-repentis Pt-1C-BFP]
MNKREDQSCVTALVLSQDSGMIETYLCALFLMPLFHDYIPPPRNLNYHKRSTLLPERNDVLSRHHERSPGITSLSRLVGSATGFTNSS